MAVLMSLGGKSGGDGFLIAPLDSTYDAEISLSTDAGTANVTLQASPNPAGLVFSTVGPIAISPIPTIVLVHSTVQSASRGDTTIQVLDTNNNVVASFTVTSIKHPVVNFNGRFEARFATDGAVYNANPQYTATLDNVVPPGRTWALEGEQPFVPAPGTVPTDLTMTGMGRVVRLNNPVALRSHADPVVSKVVSITGETASGTETFSAGDPLIGQPVDFGPDTYFASNQAVKLGETTPEEYWVGGYERMALFELRMGTSFSPPALYFRGSSQVGPFVAKKTGVAAIGDPSTRTPDSRPSANGIPGAATEIAEFGLPTQQAFSEARIDLLVNDYSALPPGDSLQRRNLNRRIGHLLGYLSAVGSAKFSQVQNNPPGPFTVRTGTASVDYNNMEVYNGKVDADLHAWPGGPPGGSSVVDYLRQFFSFDIEWRAFAFHTDELCGHHKGTLSGDVTRTGNHIGDPHVHTVNGISYDFQAVGEFTLLRDGNRMEIQVRQTPVAAANPITDGYSGLTACVSINTAVAARVGKHRISLQPGREGKLLQFYLDKKPANLPLEGIDLGASRVTAFAANGETGLRIDYEDGTVVQATPRSWNNVWLIDVSVSNTRADEGVMGFIPKDSWLPRLRNGTDVGPKPASLQDRYVTLYKKFADSWRVTAKTSLFVYAPGTSTKTFTDRDWPAEKPPCKLKPQFRIPGMRVLKGMPVAKAEMICRAVTDKDLHNNCVFDVATTGDEVFAKGYVLAQELRLYGTSVRIGCYATSNLNRSADVTPSMALPQQDDLVVVTATVLPLSKGRPIPTGTVTFFIDGLPMGRPIELDGRGEARVTLGPLKLGEHKIRATYSGGGKYDYHSGNSPHLLYTATPRANDKYKRPRERTAKAQPAVKGLERLRPKRSQGDKRTRHGEAKNRRARVTRRA